MLPEVADTSVDARHSGCVKLLERIAAEHGERLFAKPWRFDSSAWVGARLAEVLPLPGKAKQQLLELDDPSQRLDILQRLVQR
jgi:Lon protease-like protein